MAARLYFNSQPHKEADYLSDLTSSDPYHFNSQPHKEADWERTDASVGMEAFQLTASQGG